MNFQPIFIFLGPKAKVAVKKFPFILDKNFYSFNNVFFFVIFPLGLNGTLAMKFMDWTTQSSGGIGLLDYINL